MELTHKEVSEREKFDRVKDLSFFADFPKPEIWEIINARSWQEFAAEEEIIQEGSADTSFYIIVDGEVTVRKADKNLDTLSRGNCFGEMVLIAGVKRTATIVSLSEVIVMKVTSSSIDKASVNCQLRFKDVF